MQTAFAEKVLDYLLRGSTLTLPGSWYLGLDVSVSGSSYTEPTYTGYARAAVSRASGSWVTAVGAGQSVTAADVTWPAVAVGYTAAEQVRRVFISDSATSSGETLLDYVPLASLPTLVASAVPRFVAGALIVDA